MKREMIGVIFLTIMLALSPAAMAEYPDKPITAIVGFAPGGAGDVSMRALCEQAGKILGQPIMIINKPGGTGSVGLASLKKEKPDGYNISHIAGGIFISQHMRELPFDLNKDFTPIVKYGDAVVPLMVKNDSPWKTLKEFVNYAKANPGKIRYGTSGSGSVYHLAMETLAFQEGLKLIHVPFKSCALSDMALLGGHIEAEVCQPATFVSNVRSGQTRLLASFTGSRMPSFPQIPTAIELGYNIKMIHMTAIVGPKGLPKAVVTRLDRAFKEAMEGPEFKKFMMDFEMAIAYRNSDDLTREFKELTDYYKKIVAQTGVKEED
ncbi:MAG: tripartite tricarboxylate transporter substrate binding protein [Deltaproteobacteria bacterium]|nr:tripartite tricarboxylate transporter substrate binding protein [Deltaproteobacteria bacterium]